MKLSLSPHKKYLSPRVATGLDNANLKGHLVPINRYRQRHIERFINYHNIEAKWCFNNKLDQLRNKKGRADFFNEAKLLHNLRIITNYQASLSKTVIVQLFFYNNCWCKNYSCKYYFCHLTRKKSYLNLKRLLKVLYYIFISKVKPELMTNSE